MEIEAQGPPVTRAATSRREGGSEILESAPLWLLSVLILAAIAFRRPDALFNAQFFAEDGAIFFAQAYNYGPFHALFRAHVGYFATFERVAVVIAMAFPLRYAPLILNVIALMCEAAPAAFLLSRRFEDIASRRARLLMAYLLLTLPTSFELHATVTNSQWFLAVLMFMVLVAAPASLWPWGVFDLSVMVLGGLTGPFCIFLLPIAAVVVFVRRRPWNGVLFAILCATALVQAFALVHAPTGARWSQQPLGASLALLARIVGVQVILGPILSSGGLSVIGRVVEIGIVPCGLAFAVWTGLCARALIKAPIELRLFIVFAFFVLAGSLASPLASKIEPQWLAMTRLGACGRYWFLPSVATFWIYVWMLGRNQSRIIRVIAQLVLTLAVCAGILSYRQHAFIDFHFSSYAHQIAMAPEGTHVRVPINPPGWSMDLIKH